MSCCARRRCGSLRLRGGLADRLHAWLARASTPGLTGERRAVLEGVVLGEDGGLSDALKQRFRASGLYHLLAVSGGNVLVVAGGAVALALAARASARLGGGGRSRSPRSPRTCSPSDRSRP